MRFQPLSIVLDAAVDFVLGSRKPLFALITDLSTPGTMSRARLIYVIPALRSSHHPVIAILIQDVGFFRHDDFHYRSEGAGKTSARTTENRPIAIQPQADHDAWSDQYQRPLAIRPTSARSRRFARSNIAFSVALGCADCFEYGRLPRNNDGALHARTGVLVQQLHVEFGIDVPMNHRAVHLMKFELPADREGI